MVYVNCEGETQYCAKRNLVKFCLFQYTKRNVSGVMTPRRQRTHLLESTRESKSAVYLFIIYSFLFIFIYYFHVVIAFLVDL